MLRDPRPRPIAAIGAAGLDERAEVEQDFAGLHLGLGDFMRAGMRSGPDLFLPGTTIVAPFSFVNGPYAHMALTMNSNGFCLIRDMESSR